MDYLYVAAVVIAVLLSLTLHEAMHAFAGYWLGDTTAKEEGRLTLNPIKHIDPFLTLLLPITLALLHAPVFGAAKPVPFNPNNVKYGEWGSVLVALAGPFTNLVLAFVSFGVWVFAGLPDQGFGAVLLSAMIGVNLGFFVFNMFPLPPLDGSRLLYALAPEFVRRAMEAMEQFGVFIILVIVMVASSEVGMLMQSIINVFYGLFARIFGLA